MQGAKILMMTELHYFAMNDFSIIRQRYHGFNTRESQHKGRNVVMYMTNRSIPDVILSRELVFRSPLIFVPTFSEIKV